MNLTAISGYDLVLMKIITRCHKVTGGYPFIECMILEYEGTVKNLDFNQIYIYIYNMITFEV